MLSLSEDERLDVLYAFVDSVAELSGADRGAGYGANQPCHSDSAPKPVPVESAT
jgi:hypothetical protein